MSFKNHILTIPVYNDSEEVYLKKLDNKFNREIKEFKEQPDYPDKEMIFNLLKGNFYSRYPVVHRYNNIVGYAELVVDWNDILIYFYLNGDNRKIYNRNIKGRTHRNCIYFALNHIYGGTFREINNNEIRKALESSFREVEEQCKEWKVFVDLSREREIINYFDFQTYFIEKNISVRNCDTSNNLQTPVYNEP